MWTPFLTTTPIFILTTPILTTTPTPTPVPTTTTPTPTPVSRELSTARHPTTATVHNITESSPPAKSSAESKTAGEFEFFMHLLKVKILPVAIFFEGI